MTEAKINPSPTRFSVPMSSPDLTEAERKAVAAVLRTPNLSMGGEIQGFETAVQGYTGARCASASTPAPPGCTCACAPPGWPMAIW